MRVTLVQPPSNRDDTSELAPPLSLLSVAAVLEDDDVDVILVDFNLLGLQDPTFVDTDFYAKAIDVIAATNPDVVGFTSMALESHICLELARRLKILDPQVAMIMGGPHFTGIANQVMGLFDWVDYVVTGEGELPARTLIRYLRGKASLSDLSNVAFRHRGIVELNRCYKPWTTLDDLPFPAYHLVDVEQYFELNPYRVLDIEHARGCMLKCAFCYSTGHWGHGEQSKRIDHIVEDVHRHYELGARHLFFVADNFVNSRSFAKGVSDALTSANPGLTWRCYATLPQLTEDLLDAMAKSDCRYLFIGIDAVSENTKKQFRKHYFKGWPALRDRLQMCLDRGITPTCAYMLNPPDAGVADTEAALVGAVHTYNHHCGVRLNPLTIYPGTGLETLYRRQNCEYSDAKARLLLDGSSITRNNSYARRHPELFPFHSTVGEAQHYDQFIATTHACFTLLDHFPRTLMQWIHFEQQPLWEVIAAAAAQTDYSGEDKACWRISEVDAFARVLQQRRVSSSVRDTLTFELTEHQLRRSDPGLPVRVDVDSTTLDFSLNPHAVIRLSRPPTDYETTTPQHANAVADRHYLLVARGAAVRYLEPDAAMVDLLEDLELAAVSGDAVNASADRIAGLMASGTLQLAGTQAGVT